MICLLEYHLATKRVSPGLGISHGVELGGLVILCTGVAVVVRRDEDLGTGEQQKKK